MSPSISLPLELLELCIDAISLDSEEGRNTLRSCLVVSKGLLPRVRSRLLEHIIITPMGIATGRTTSLRYLLEFNGCVYTTGSSNNPIYVKSLKITWPYEAFMSQDSEQEVTRLGGMVNGEDIVAILCLLAKTGVLQSLELTFLRSTPFPNFEAATYLYNPIREILFQTPSLETLKVENITDVPASFVDIWKTRELSLNKLEFSSSEHDPEPPSPTSDSPSNCPASPCLETFTYLARPPLPSQWFDTGSPFTSLRNLTLKFDSKSKPAHPSRLVSSLLALSFSSLHTLHIHISLNNLCYHYPHTLNHLISLQELRFTVVANISFGGISYQQRSLFDRTKDVVRILRTFDPESGLETHSNGVPPSLNRIVIFFFTLIGFGRNIEFRDERDWQDLGDVLMEKRFEQVERKEVIFVRLGDGPNGAEKIPDGVGQQVPFLRDFPKAWVERYPEIRVGVKRFQATRFRDEFLC